MGEHTNNVHFNQTQWCIPIILALWRRRQKGHYGGLNENCPHVLIYLNAWSPVGGSIWERLGGVASLEEVCYYL